MKEVVKLMDYRPDIKIVDATLRDGGLVNNFRFTDEFVKDLYQTNIKAGVDVMEFGYKADKEMFDVKDFGKWKFCDDEDIRAVVGDNNTDLKIAVMADVGRCNYKQDIKPRAESPVDVIRVATYINQIPAAVDVIEDAVAKGYEVTCNIMAISNAQEADIRVALDLLGKSPVNVIYIVDSFGALFRNDTIRFQISEQENEFRAAIEERERFNLSLGMKEQNHDYYHFFPPVEGIVTQSFDEKKRHYGTDIVAKANAKVAAVLDGVVIFTDWTVKTGYVIQVQHTNDLISVYKHNSILLKKQGDYVRAGEVLGVVGNTGEESSGPHLHFELWRAGNPLNPENFIKFK